MFSNNSTVTAYSQKNLSPDIESGRVVVIEDSFPVISETFILDQITALMDRGFNIENWALNYLDQGVCHSKVINYGLIEKTRYLKLPNAAYMSKPAEWTSEFAQRNGLGDLTDIRAFHVNYGTNFFAFEPLFQTLDAYLIVSFYGYDASKYILENGDHCYDTLFKRADLITTNTIYMMKTLIRIGCPEHKIKVIRCGVEIPADPVQFGIDNTKITLLTVARLVEKKGIEYALRALAVCSVRKKIMYRIIGDGPLNDELRHLATQLGIDDQVEFLGFLPIEKMQEEMRQADIVLLTSVTATNGDQEGLPVTLVAAQAMGLPVISSYHSGIEELVVHGITGLLSQEREVNQIATHIQMLANDPNMRKSFGTNGRERVMAEFDKEKNIDQLARFLLDGVNNKHRKKASRMECPICGGVYDSFASYGVEPRPNALCPGCQSLERHRLLWLFLKEKTNLFTSTRLKVLDIAPVPFLSERIKRIPFVQYLSIDIHSPHAMRKMDITNLLLPDDYFDCILCYHVLEHVPNDHKAISELYRVMKPGGWGILQVPLKQGLENTIEDLNITDPQERLRLYGNEDHVRYYGLDFKDRLEREGFTVHVDPFVHTLLESLVRRYGLQHDEDIYVACKPSCGTKSAKADPADTLNEKNRNDISGLGCSSAMGRYPVAWQSGHVPNFFQPATSHSNIAVESNAELFISILTPTYNRGKYLADAVASALAQEYGRFEVVVVDDGSTDDTAAIVGSFHDPRLRYILKEHSGAPATRNLCIAEATSDFIVWLDSDDLLLPHTLQYYAEALQRDPAVDVLYGDLLVFSNDSNSGNIWNYQDYSAFPEAVLPGMFLRNSLPNVCTLVRKSCYEKVGAYSPEFPRAHDYEFWSRLARVGRFRHVQRVVGKYRQHQKSLSTTGGRAKTIYESKVVEKMLEENPLSILFPYCYRNGFPQSRSDAHALRLAACVLLKWGNHVTALNLIKRSLACSALEEGERLHRLLGKLHCETPIEELGVYRNDIQSPEFKALVDIFIEARNVGNLASCAEACSKMMEMEPDALETLCAMGYCLSDSDNSDGARTAFEMLIKSQLEVVFADILSSEADDTDQLSVEWINKWKL